MTSTSVTYRKTEEEERRRIPYGESAISAGGLVSIRYRGPAPNTAAMAGGGAALGAIIGAVLGFVVAGPIGAAIGGALGGAIGGGAGGYVGAIIDEQLTKQQEKKEGRTKP